MKMKLKIFCLIYVAFVVAEAALVPPLDNHESKFVHSRQKRTLGLVTAGAQAVAGGVAGAGQLAGAAVSTIAAAKPLILLGLGKYALLSWLLRKRNVPAAPAYAPITTSNVAYVYPASEWVVEPVNTNEPAWVESAHQTVSYPIVEPVAPPPAWKRR